MMVVMVILDRFICNNCAIYTLEGAVDYLAALICQMRCIYFLFLLI